jgi:hypothetical protein
MTGTRKPRPRKSRKLVVRRKVRRQRLSEKRGVRREEEQPRCP